MNVSSSPDSSDAQSYLISSAAIASPGQTLRFTWHLSSVAWLGLAGVLISFTYTDPIQTRAFALQFISLTFLMNAIITFLATRGRHLAWIVFLGIAFVAWLGVG